MVLLLIAKSFAFSQCDATLVTNCCQNINSNFIFLLNYKAKLGKAPSKAEIPVARYSVLLSKGNTYRLDVCSALDFEGEAILQLYDGTKLVASTYQAETKTDFKAFEFYCSKTAIYKIYISFLDGRPGCAVGILSMKK